jgi:hypothetical protein
MTRASRDSDTREESLRDTPWAPAATLPTPAPMDGWRFKWVRRMSLGETDIMNMSKRRREGWEPVPAEEQPDLADFTDTPGVVEIGGLVLCRMPEERARSRDKYFADKARSQIDGLDRQYKSDASPDQRMPIFEERKTKVTRSPD